LKSFQNSLIPALKVWPLLKPISFVLDSLEVPL
jgi:hypothetical protein